MTRRNDRYLQDKTLQLYPYGYGLSYNSWAAPTLHCTTPTSSPPNDRGVGYDRGVGCNSVSANDVGRVNVTVSIQNTGTRIGSRPILLFAQRLDNKEASREVKGEEVGGNVGGLGGLGGGNVIDVGNGKRGADAANVAADTTVIWPNKWLVAFTKVKDVQPKEVQAVTLGFGKEEMARWLDGPGGGTSGFKVLPGRYLLTVTDQQGLPSAASLTLTVTA